MMKMMMTMMMMIDNECDGDGNVYDDNLLTMPDCHSTGVDQNHHLIISL